MGRPLNTDGRETREALLDAGRAVFAEKGFHGASLKEIAAIVGVRDSAIYHYFPSKEALFDAIAAERRERASEEDRKVLLDAPIANLRAFLERMGHSIIERMESPRGQKLYRILMTDGLRLHTESRVNLLRSSDDGLLAKLMERLIKEKKLRAARPDLLAIEFMAPFHIRMMIRLLQLNHPLAKDSAAFVREHVEQFLAGAARKQK